MDLNKAKQGFRETASEGVVESYDWRWKPVVDRWCSFTEKNYRPFGNMTTNRIERLFYMLEATMRNGGKKRGKRMHLAASVRVTGICA